MKHISAGIKIGVLVIVASVLGYMVWKSVGEQAAGVEGFRLNARFRDASGLPRKSRVVIAGLPVGEISDRGLEGNRARITVRIRRDTVIWSNAAIYKKSSSLLGEHYIEIDPGMPETNDVPNRRMKDGDEIINVYEATSTDDLLRKVNETLPHANAVLDEIRGLAAEVREVVKGPVKNMATTLDTTIQEDSELVHSILDRADRALESIDVIARDMAGVTAGKGDDVQRILSNIEQVSVDLKDLVASAKGEVGTTGQTIRAKLDRMDRALDSLDKTFAATAELGAKLNDDQGTLGRLINDPQIGDDLASISNDVSGFVKTAFGLQTIVGMRTEYNVVANAWRSYFSLELAPRPDKYYLVELVDDPRGKVADTFVPDPATGKLVRSTVVEEALRVTFQFAKRVDRYVLRVGVKESHGGAGLDVHLFDDRLTLSSDMFDFSFNEAPRLRFLAAFKIFSFLYVYGGVDDVLNASRSVEVMNANLAGETSRFHFGRDVFGGVALRFNDQDLAALLFIGGSAIGGMTK